MRSIANLAAVVLLAGSVHAAPLQQGPHLPMPPVVIHDEGGVSLTPLLDPPDLAEPAPARPAVIAPAGRQRLAIYPVSSQRGAPGRLLKNPTRAQLEGGPGQPFFIVGDDPISREWLRINAKHLRKLGAYGIVTAVDSATRLNHMVNALQIPMAPINADSLFEALGFAVWPVLVSADGSISQ